MELHLPNLREGYVELVDVVLGGHDVTSRDLDATEVTAVTLVFNDPLAPLVPVAVGRRVNLRLAAVEALQLVAGVSHADLLRRAAPTYDHVLVDPTNLNYGAYGPRTYEQVPDCVELLRVDPGTRRAVVSIWRGEDLTHDGDRPCTVFLQFLVRPQYTTFDAGSSSVEQPPALELHVHMRSQDVWLGVPYDVFMFSQLQHTVARELRLPTGRYVHHTTSLHLYDADRVKARELVDHRNDHTQHQVIDIDDLPLGLVATNVDDTGFDVASYLLDGLATDVEREVNPWYARQLDAVRDAEVTR